MSFITLGLLKSAPLNFFTNSLYSFSPNASLIATISLPKNSSLNWDDLSCDFGKADIASKVYSKAYALPNMLSGFWAVTSTTPSPFLSLNIDFAILATCSGFAILVDAKPISPSTFGFSAV